MKVKTLFLYALPLICSVLLLFFSQEVEGQRTLLKSDTINELSNPVVRVVSSHNDKENISNNERHKASPTAPIVQFKDTYIGKEDTYIIEFMFRNGVEFSSSITWSFDSDQFEIVHQNGVGDENNRAQLEVKFKPSVAGDMRATLIILEKGKEAKDGFYYALRGTGVPTSSLVLYEDSPVPSTHIYSDAKLTLEFKDLSKYHFISVPFNPTRIEVKGSDNVVVDASKYVMYTYDSEIRARRGLEETLNNWFKVTDYASIEASKGYIIGFDDIIPSPVKVSFISDEKVMVYRSNSMSLSKLPARKSEDANWYLVGSKLFDDYSMRGEDHLRYAQVYNGIDYDLKVLSPSASFKKYSSSFVQYAGTLTNRYPTRSVSAPMQKNFSSLDEDQYILSLTDGTKTKEVVIVAASEGDDSYQVGGDLLSMGAMGQVDLALSINHPSGKLVADYISKENHTLVLDTKTAETKEYTFSLQGEHSSNAVYLYDSVTGDRINLLETDYSFIGKSNKSNRFTIEIAALQVPTSAEPKIETDLYFISEKGKLRIENLNKEYDFELLDISGKKVVEYFHQSIDFEITDLKSGLYFIVCNSGKGSFIEKVIIK